MSKDSRLSPRDGGARAGQRGDPLARVGQLRADNVMPRLIGLAVAAPLATWLVASWAPVFWFMAYLPTLMIERRVALGLVRAREAGQPINLPVLAAWTFFQSAVVNTLPVILWLGEPRHGDALAVLVMASTATNAVLTQRESRPLLAAALAPVFLILISFSAADLLTRGPGGVFSDLTPLLAAVALTTQGVCVLRRLSHADAAHVQAADAARAAQTAAKNALNARAEFTATMIQEVRTPMAALTGAAELLRRTNLSGEARLYVETLIDSSEVVAAVLDDLADVDGVSSGCVRINPRATDLRALLRSIVATFRSEAEEKGLELFLDVADAAPERVLVDPVRVRQILFNLVSNAIKFTQNGGVRVRLQVAPGATEGHVRLGFAVADTGVGMARAEIERALGERRATPTHKGLGLVISAKLARLMNARLAAKSARGQGSLFSLVLEAAVLVEEPAAPAPVAQVLVIESEAAERRAIAAALDDTAWRYDMAENADRAREMLALHRYHLVIADQRMADLDAIDVAELLRRGGPNAATPVVALLDLGDVGAPALCAESGVDGSVTLPLAPAALLAEIGRVLGAPPPAASWAA